MSGSELVWLGLGSNLGDRMRELREAMALLERAGLSVVRMSTVRETPPWGKLDQPAFLNAVVELDVGLMGPRELLQLARSIEDAHGRQRTERWGPRRLDLDILRFGDRAVGGPDLTIPHPRIGERGFVLVSLAELEPEWRLPSGLTVRQALSGFEPNDFPIFATDWAV